MEMINAKEWYEKIQLEYNDALSKFDAADEAAYDNPSTLKRAALTRAERLLIEAENRCEVADAIRIVMHQSKSGTITLSIPELNIEGVTLKW